MTKSLKRRTLALAALLGLLILAALALPPLLDLDAYKPRLEAAATRALGMEVDIGGGVGLALFPDLRVTLGDVRLRNPGGDRGAEVARARQVRLGIDFLPLLRGQLRIGSIALEQPHIHIERDRQGRLNLPAADPTGAPVPALHLARLTLSDASLRYLDQRAGKSNQATSHQATSYQAAHCNLEVDDLRLAARTRPLTARDIGLAARLACREIGGERLAASDLRLALTGKDGVFTLEPATLRVFDGLGSGSIRADFTGPVPRYQVRYTLARFRLESFLASLSPQKVATGALDLTLDLSLQGRSLRELRRSTQGRVSLRGKDLVLHGRDLDETFARFESSQNFNLVDLGAYFFTGPLGLAATKGYDFARIFHGTGGRSAIRTLVSDWNIDHGVARAQDVAMATNRNRVALRGSLDLAEERFNGVTLALVDARGCAKVRQNLRGSFQHPVVEPPSTLESLGGPVLKLWDKARGLFAGDTCVAFYAGSVAPPK